MEETTATHEQKSDSDTPPSSQPSSSTNAPGNDKRLMMLAFALFGVMVLFFAAGVAYTILNLSKKNEVAFSATPVESPTPTPEPLEFTQKRYLDDKYEQISFYQGNEEVFDAAVFDLKRFIEKYPEHARANGILAMGLIYHAYPGYPYSLQKEFYDEGKAAYEAGLLADPNNLESLYARFDHESAIKAEAKAQATFEELTAKHPDAMLVEFTRGRLENRHGNYDEAIAISDSMLAKDLNKVERWNALALKEFALDKQGNVEELDKVYPQMIEITEGSWDYDDYGEFLIKQDNYEKGLEMLEKSRGKVDYDGIRIRIQKYSITYGERLYANEEYEKAFKVFDNAVSSYPADCGCGYLQKIASYYRIYGDKTDDPFYTNRAKEILDLIRHPRI